MRPGASQPLHGTAVARFTPAGWRGVLITGPSGAGKSDLALRLTGRGWRLVADDYVHVFAPLAPPARGGFDALAGRMEARGVGIVPACASGVVPLALEIALTADRVERLPDPDADPGRGRPAPPAAEPLRGLGGRKGRGRVVGANRARSWAISRGLRFVQAAGTRGRETFGEAFMIGLVIVTHGGLASNSCRRWSTSWVPSVRGRGHLHRPRGRHASGAGATSPTPRARWTTATG